VDNDPHFELHPLNIPLAHPREPISLQTTGAEMEILWQARDRHGFSRVCGTKVNFVDGPAIHKTADGEQNGAGEGEGEGPWEKVLIFKLNNFCCTNLRDRNLKVELVKKS
jgi:hypothetical protein